MDLVVIGECGERWMGRWMVGGWVGKVDWKGGWCVKNHMAGQLVHF